MQLAARRAAIRPLYTGAQPRAVTARPVLSRSTAQDEAALSVGDQARLDRIAEALVARMEELPEGALPEEDVPPEDGASRRCALRCALRPPPSPLARPAPRRARMHMTSSRQPCAHPGQLHTPQAARRLPAAPAAPRIRAPATPTWRSLALDAARTPFAHPRRIF